MLGIHASLKEQTAICGVVYPYAVAEGRGTINAALLAEPGCAADALQRSLRSRFQARLTPGVRLLREGEDDGTLRPVAIAQQCRRNV